MNKAPNLSKNEVQYFYYLLYILERVTKYKGFNISRTDAKVRNLVDLNPNYTDKESVPKPSNKNAINYRGKSNHSRYLLKHIRNSFAHGLLESRGDDFYFLDIPPGKENESNLEAVASMIGTVNKEVFYELIEAIFNTNKLTKSVL